MTKNSRSWRERDEFSWFFSFENVADLKLSFQIGYIKKMLREKYEKKFLISSTIFDQNLVRTIPENLNTNEYVHFICLI